MTSKLLEKRKKFGYLQKQVAILAGIEVRTLWALERDKSQPKYKTASKLAKIFRCKPEDLFDNIL